SFAYSLGEPRGSSRDGSTYCDVLRDVTGQRVPCRTSHATCNACIYADLEALSAPYSQASRGAIQTRVLHESVTQDAQLLEKTMSYWAALWRNGCGAPHDPYQTQSEIMPLVDGQSWRETWDEQQNERRRGQAIKVTCQGELIFSHDNKGRPFIHCEFYDKNSTRDHLLDYSPDAGLYDIDYLRALFNEDREEILAIEEGAKTLGFDPSSCCTMVTNHTSVRVKCPRTHRNQDGQLELAPMTRLRCSSLFRVYQPLEEYRTVCSKVLVVCSGQHTHPIPLPTKTPPHIRNEIFNILRHMDYDLPDLTPRRFLRHPSLLKYVESQLSNCHHPTLTDVHISLANRDHLRSYITHVQKLSFPLGTGWRGLLHLKNVHDLELPPEHRYVRLATEFPRISESSDGQEDEDSSGSPFRLVICMFPESSRRLKKAQYLQSDVGFKRIQGFQEFELGGKDMKSNITLTYCRIFLTRQTAAAHELVFHEINRIVESDTGSPLKWRHLHGTDLNDLTGILQWTSDQHGGQAKGLGLHLRQLAQQMPNRFDLHEPHRPLSTLTEYDHLRRVYRLCAVHIFRNIKTSPVNDSVKNMMRSLVCIEHSDFQGTVQEIQTS
ncbi:hypothetical protein PAXINDRAFT_43681, partial [Paxillus involutus ATCC 200175]